MFPGSKHELDLHWFLSRIEIRFASRVVCVNEGCYTVKYTLMEDIHPFPPSPGGVAVDVS